MKPCIYYKDKGFLLYPPQGLRGDAAAAFLRFSADYFQALAMRYGETAELELGRDRLVADLSRAPRTLRAARALGTKRTFQGKG